MFLIRSFALRTHELIISFCFNNVYPSVAFSPSKIVKNPLKPFHFISDSVWTVSTVNSILFFYWYVLLSRGFCTRVENKTSTKSKLRFQLTFLVHVLIPLAMFFAIKLAVFIKICFNCPFLSPKTAFRYGGGKEKIDRVMFYSIT